MVATSRRAASRRTARGSGRRLGARDRSAPQPYRHLGCDECHRLVAQKKTPTARERDRPDVKAKRETFAEEQASLKANRLIFLDESGFRLGAPPHYGWAPIGEKSPGKSVQGAWQTMTMIGAIALDGFRGLMTVDAATNAAVFRAFVDQVLNILLSIILSKRRGPRSRLSCAASIPKLASLLTPLLPAR